MNLKVFNLKLRVNKKRFLIQNDRLIINVDWMKVNLIQSKNGVLANVGVSVKSYIIEALVRMFICGILARFIVSKISHVKLTND